MPSVQILMATCEGEKYLAPQLASLLAQTCTDWELLLRDDASTDATLKIAERFAAEIPGKITILRDDAGRLGITGNFEKLLQHVTAPYAMFCDQDDIWLPEKISKSLEAMRALEMQRGAATPLLVTTDLMVVGATGQDVLVPRYNRRFRASPPDFSRIFDMAVHGMTMMMNRALVQACLPLASFHDDWVLCTALATGEVAAIDMPLVKWRRHGGNATASQEAHMRKGWLHKCAHGLRTLPASRADFRRRLRLNVQKSVTLLQRFPQLPGRATLEAVAALASQPRLQRLITVCRHRLYFGPPVSFCKSCLFLLTYPREHP